MIVKRTGTNSNTNVLFDVSRAHIGLEFVYDFPPMSADQQVKTTENLYFEDARAVQSGIVRSGDEQVEHVSDQR